MHLDTMGRGGTNLMIILASTNQTIPASQLVNKVGKYLYKHIDSAYKFNTCPNTYDVWFTIYYQYSQEWREVMDDDNLYEMNINLNITTYQNKIRVNIIEVTPEEQTIGHDVYPSEKFTDIQKGCELVLNKFRRRMEKAFEEYEFIY